MPRCWECDSEVERSIEVPLPLAVAADTVIRLCQRCHRERYIPLVVEYVDEIRQATGLREAGCEHDE